MTIAQLIEVGSLSSGTIAKALGSCEYSEIDKFVEKLFTPILKDPDILFGSIVSYGDNVLTALDNAVKVYNRHGRTSFRTS